MVTLPLLISLPHAGIKTPPEVESISMLTPQQIIEDGDEGAARIYSIRDQVKAFVTTDIARAFVDINRVEDDLSPDGVVKIHTIWKVPIYRQPLSEDLIQILLDKYYRPYHKQLSQFTSEARLGVDCHTMADVGPPIGPDANRKRPSICLSNAKGTCPEDWFNRLVDCLEEAFETEVSKNKPFKGGYIIRSHAHELPWVQIELSRAAFLSHAQKRSKFLEALDEWCRITLSR
jgi:N-formylglutamate deformylase